MDRLLDWLTNAARFVGEAGLQVGETRITVASILTLLAVLVGSWLAARYLERGVQRFVSRHSEAGVASSAAYALGRLLRYAVWVLGSIVGLQLIGFEVASLALIGGAVGIGIGFGLQNLVGNFVSGIVLLVEKTVRVGDFVDLESGVRGTVSEIAVRYTRITTNSAVDVIVPNSELTGARLINWTLDSPYRRLNVPFSVAYGSDKDKVREAALAAAGAVKHTVTDALRKPDVWFTRFGESALEFELVVWVGPEAVHRPGTATSHYLWAIDDALRARGIEIPFPQRDLHVRSGRLAVALERDDGAPPEDT